MNNQPASLFNKPKSKYINAYDINENIVKRNADEFRFRLSVYGILIHKGKVLLQHNPIIDQLGIPGGGVEIDEFMEDALKREFYEETGLEVKVGKLISIKENFFTHNREDAHAIIVYFQVSTQAKGDLERDKLTNEDSDYTKLVPLDKLDQYNIVKIFRKFLDTTSISAY